ncbi:hypothetical protein FBEOM_11662 [Fusarium beomiforme]|uniref:Uncharacterized protein n=1 Tax=Fusarium beomiforme TaxID=44412 RepID=A0A9P5AA31_9HYPO|nr:hypothetical protein FBEOM_11662 [Fusarium beomiforme]
MMDNKSLSDRTQSLLDDIVKFNGDADDFKSLSDTLAIFVPKTNAFLALWPAVNALRQNKVTDQYMRRLGFFFKQLFGPDKDLSDKDLKLGKRQTLRGVKFYPALLIGMSLSIAKLRSSKDEYLSVICNLAAYFVDVFKLEPFFSTKNIRDAIEKAETNGFPFGDWHSDKESCKASIGSVNKFPAIDTTPNDNTPSNNDNDPLNGNTLASKRRVDEEATDATAQNLQKRMRIETAAQPEVSAAENTGRLCQEHHPKGRCPTLPCIVTQEPMEGIQLRNPSDRANAPGSQVWSATHPEDQLYDQPRLLPSIQSPNGTFEYRNPGTTDCLIAEQAFTFNLQTTTFQSGNGSTATLDMAEMMNPSFGWGLWLESMPSGSS